MKRYWFKRKTYGWGWYPSTWQGWSIILMYLVLLMILLNISPLSTQEDSGIFLIGIALLTGTLIIICYVTGESPKWQWGEKNNRK